MFCESCGKQIPEDSKFCEHCGAAVNQESGNSADAFPQYGPAVQAPAAPAAPRAPLSMKTKVIIGVVAGVVVIGVAAKVILGMVFSPEKTVDKFLNAMQAQDVAGIKSCATVNSDQVELNEQTLAPFFALYSGDENTLAMWRQELTNAVNVVKNGGTDGTDDTVRLVKKSNPLFSTYQVEIQSAQVCLESDFEGVTVEVAETGQAVEADGTQTLTVLPGEYNCQVGYTSPETGLSITDEQQYTFYSGEGQWEYVYLTYYDVTLREGDGVTITGVEIDGAPYTGELGEEISILPLNEDSQLVITGEAYGMEFQKTVVAGESSWVTVNYTMSEEEELEYQEMAKTAMVQIMKTGLSGDQASLDELKKAYPDSDWSRLESDKDSLFETGWFSRSGVEISELTVAEVTDFDYYNYGGDYLSVYVYMDMEISGTYYSSFSDKEGEKALDKASASARVTLRVDENGVTVDSYSYDRYF